MKNQLLKIILSVTLLFCCTSCILLGIIAPNDLYSVSRQWEVQNNTNNPIILRSFVEKDLRVGVGESAVLSDIYRRSVEEHQIQFEELYTYNKITTVCIYDESETVLKTWYVSEKDLAGKQLFNESHWKYQQIENQKYAKYGLWTFIIEEADISIE